MGEGVGVCWGWGREGRVGDCWAGGEGGGCSAGWCEKGGEEEGGGMEARRRHERHIKQSREESPRSVKATAPANDATEALDYVALWPLFALVICSKDPSLRLASLVIRSDDSLPPGRFALVES